MPLLEWDAPRECVELSAAELIRGQEVVSLTVNMKVADIERILLTTDHSGYPIVDSDSVLKGFILRSTLQAMIADRATDSSEAERLNRFYPR